jgi:hypothetical protein
MHLLFAGMCTGSKEVLDTNIEVYLYAYLIKHYALNMYGAAEV